MVELLEIIFSIFSGKWFLIDKINSSIHELHKLALR